MLLFHQILIETMKKVLLFILLIGIGTIKVKAQNVQEKTFFGQDTVEIKYFNENDTFPKTMNIEGEIVGISTGTSCGIFLSSGTLKIRLIKDIKGYSDSLLYVVVPCLTKGEELIGENFSFTVTALYQNNEECYKPILNRFNSNGTPFYWLNQVERNKFHKQFNQ